MSARDDYGIDSDFDPVTILMVNAVEMCAEIDRLRAIKKSDDGAYEHVVEMWHLADSEASILADKLTQSEYREKAWMNGVADAVERLGYDREAACGPADLLPGLLTLTEFWENLRDEAPPCP